MEEALWKSADKLRGSVEPAEYKHVVLSLFLIDEINRINTDDKENDIIGRVYEYFLSKFALTEDKDKSEFYTPKCIVNLIAEMLEPYGGILYERKTTRLIKGLEANTQESA